MEITITITALFGNYQWLNVVRFSNIAYNTL